MPSFDHERLHVYQHSLDFVAWTETFLESVKGRASAKDHLSRASLSIPMNIADGNSRRSFNERVPILEIAIGSTLECAAALDVLLAKGRAAKEQVFPAKADLWKIASMLYGLRKSNVDRVEEEPVEYESKGRQFAHERLRAYQSALIFITWTEDALGERPGFTKYLNQLDKSSTGAVLNIAEGNGKFSGQDRARFLDFAITASLKCTSLLDVLGKLDSELEGPRDSGKKILLETVSLVVGLRRKTLELGAD